MIHDLGFLVLYLVVGVFVAGVVYGDEPSPPNMAGLTVVVFLWPVGLRSSLRRASYEP
jgi:predicted Kef-type K+ transport protein